MNRTSAIDSARGANWGKQEVKVREVMLDTRTDAVRYLFIVSRDQPELYDRLRRDFAKDKEVEVLLDRRVRDRRQGGPAPRLERRRAGRRRQPEGWTIPLARLYRGERPCVVLLAQDPIAPPTGRRSDGSSFFRRRSGTSCLNDVVQRTLGSPAGHSQSTAEVSDALAPLWVCADTPGAGR